MNFVKPKKHLGQHFLKNDHIAQQIAEALSESSTKVLEIGPGTGVLTKHLVKSKTIDKLTLVELDNESVVYLNENYKNNEFELIEGDFLKYNWVSYYEEGNFSIIGNFPYNISSQIFFNVLEMKHQVDEVVCMLQKEVAERLASKHGNKSYGILSVLLQAWYDVEYLFTVLEDEFIPPPKVKSGVIRVKRNDRKVLDCDEKLFKKVVKQAFSTRRKTLRNALKVLNLPDSVLAHDFMTKRAEQLSVQNFIELTLLIQNPQN